MAAHNQLGKKGEDIALEYITAIGYTLLATNWRYKKAEVDIIAKTKNTIVFIEVKTRSTVYFGAPQEAVTKQKQTLLLEAAEAYLQENNLNYDIRFDIISIVISGTSNKPELKHIQDAFSGWM